MNQTFADLGISPKLLTILTKLGFTTPTNIQAQAIPIAMQGNDVIGIAQTGTGKTLAFSLPLIKRIAATNKKGLIVLPTRELAMQVEDELKKIGNNIGLKTALLIGGSSEKRQIQQLSLRPHIIIGTPGRMNDLLDQRKLNLSQVGALVLDEADRMLDMGFAPQIKRIIDRLPSQRQTMLFSATMPKEVMHLVNKYMTNPVRVEVETAGTVAKKVAQELFVVDKYQKNQLLNKLLDDHYGTVLVFSRTKYGAKRICRDINRMGHQAAEMHSNLSTGQRRRSLEGFKTGKHRVLVATDIAARGIDVSGIELVINYDLPDNPDDYVHRVGRTGRAGQVGKAISFASADQRKEVDGIERSVNQRINISPLPEMPQLKHQTTRERFSQGHRSRRAPRRRPSRSRNHQSSRSTARTRVHT